MAVRIISIIKTKEGHIIKVDDVVTLKTTMFTFTKCTVAAIENLGFVLIDYVAENGERKLAQFHKSDIVSIVPFNGGVKYV